jgi:glycosyltransferase involved in cell wall biosynthesis
MKISVLIPCYNAGKTIEATLASVFAQTLQPDEILVLNDGSADDTLARLEKFKDRVVVLSQKNSGAAEARNRLVATARGDILAFLDADDLWHPSYLKIQRQMIKAFPQAVGYFTWHDDFVGYGPYSFRDDLLVQPLDAKMIGPEAFIVEYNRRPMRFQMSCFCMPKQALSKMDGEPFCVPGGEDTYLHTMLPLLGSIVHTTLPLVAYRVLDSSLSYNQLKCSLAVVTALDRLDAHYRKSKDPLLYRAFKDVNASRKRSYGKYLMGAKRVPEARKLFLRAATVSRNPVSIVKSFGLFCSTLLPGTLQPKWPGSQRRFQDCILKTAAVQG